MAASGRIHRQVTGRLQGKINGILDSLPTKYKQNKDLIIYYIV